MTPFASGEQPRSGDDAPSGNVPPLRISGAPGSGAWAYLALTRLSGEDRRPLVIVRKDEEAAEDVADALKALEPLFPALSLGEPAFFGEDAGTCLASLEKLHRGASVVLACPEGLAFRCPDSGSYAQSRLRLRLGKGLSRSALLESLGTLGYRRVDFVESPGEFAARGAVVDLFPLEPLEALRVLYDGDAIESLRRFDPQTQTPHPEFLREAWAMPTRLDPELASGRDTLGSRLAPAGFWLVEEGVEVGEAAPALGAVVGLPVPDCSDFGAVEAPGSGGDLSALSERCGRWLREGWRVLFFSMNRGEDERIQEVLGVSGVQFLIGPLREGFLLPARKTAVLSSAQVLGRGWRPMRRRGYEGTGPRLRWGELKKGDFVVHSGHGVARYLGLESVDVSAATTDCLKLEYRGGDKLFIPMADFRQVHKFIGAEGRRPKLSSLDGRGWEEAKARAAQGAQEMAAELLKNAALRSALPGRSFPPDSVMEGEFARSFPYEETPDQRRAIEEVKADMQSPHPMDRVVVGDVGFGKTEVAMRAALKCVEGGAQAAVFVPTTILADQHARTFRGRFAEYPVRTASLSRFTPGAEARRVLFALAEGSIDVVIGTQRLLAKDVRFKDLGLCVIDEEQRFGVKDKERLRTLRKGVDCLTLSATPIPRTLYQALSGLRAVSLMRSAPTGRQPITTEVRPYDEGHAVSAIEAELARGGQAFFVHNRVRSLPEAVAKLKARLPGARIAMAHGRMSGPELEETMWAFFRREYDVLAASSIIESGLDIPSVNTLLIEDAHEFGLAQLYQLRGRIGREKRRAYCCLYYPKDPGAAALLSEEAKSRLSALREFGGLGSGLMLAMRDLEIRGAGDLLGGRQHGHLDAVGLEYYCRLLEAEVSRLKRKGAPEPEAVEPAQLDLGVRAYLPEDYLPGDLERIEFYKRLLAAEPGKL
ncbi:MAG: DEAD/DEAH box helicase, partial [Elusimicrobiota bacterium]